MWLSKEARVLRLYDYRRGAHRRADRTVGRGRGGGCGDPPHEELRDEGCRRYFFGAGAGTLGACAGAFGAGAFGVAGLAGALCVVPLLAPDINDEGPRS